MAEKSDAELVDQARAGDRAAFAELVRRYLPQLLRVVRRYLSDEDDAEDARLRLLNLYPSSPEAEQARNGGIPC